MNTQKTIPFTFALKYGLILTAIPVVYRTILVVFDLLMEYHGDDAGGSIKMFTFLLILPIVIVLAIRKYKKVNTGFLKLKDALGIGLTISLVSLIINIGYDVLFNTVLAPTFYEDYYQLNGQDLLAEFSEFTDDPKVELERHKNLRLKYWTAYRGDIIFFTLLGLITATITGLIMKKK